jgi:lysozyme family protein
VITDEDIIDRIILAEGGIYTNDPDDAGGPTRWGITIPVLSKHRKRQVNANDIRILARDEAEDIYRVQFVRPFDGIGEHVRVNAIDFGVNAGVYRAVFLLQQIIGADTDGKIGLQTRSLSSLRNWNDLYVGGRLSFYEDLIISKPHNRKWRNGWRNRAMSFVSGTPLRMMSSEERKRGTPMFGFMGKAA